MPNTLRNLVLALRDLVLPYIPFLRLNKYDFAFLVHPRHITDIYKQYSIIKYIPEKLVKFFLYYFWPLTVQDIEGPISLKSGEKIRGILINIPLIPEQILKYKTTGLKRIIKACVLGQKLGVKIVGLGALTSSISQGGELLKGKVNVFLTNGNSLTVGNSILSIKEIIKEQGIEKNDISIAVIGATGSIGSAISELLLIHNFSHLILIGNTPKHIDALKQRLSFYEAVKEGKVIFTNRLDEIKKAQFVIMAVAKEHLINDSHLLQKNAIIYDISQPKGIHPDVVKNRPDIMLFDGGLARTPHINFPLDYVLSQPEINFSCVAETILLSAEEVKDNFIGQVTIDEAESMIKLAGKYHFTPYHN